MSFEDRIEQIANSSETRGNGITDGQFACTYGEIPLLLDQVDRHLEEYSENSDGCLAVECPNSLASALLLLALLRKKRSFVLAPPVYDNQELKPTPLFCSCHIKVIAASHGDREPFSPVRFFHVEPNSNYNGTTVLPGKLYLRTSGSMGASKLVVHGHEKLYGNAGNVASKYGFTSASRALIPVPVAHMYGFGAEFLPAVLAGAGIDLQEKINLLKYLDREKRFQPTIAFVTPNICEMLLKGYKAPRTHYSVFVTSGQRISEELFRAFDPYVSGRLINQYGSTEMGATSACDPGDSLEQRATTIGRPMAGVELRIDPAQDNSYSMAGAGDLFCRHPYGFEGYVDEQGAWLQQAPADNWYRTGDIAATRPDGQIVILGRADASVNRSGYLVLLSDIERMLEKLDTFGQVVVVAGKGESRHGQRIAAFCIPRGASQLDGAQLRQQCFGVLPHYAIPDEVHVAQQLPLLPSGKVDRRSLAAGLDKWISN